MPFIDGIGDELIYAAIVAAPVVLLCRTSLGQQLNWLKHGMFVVRKWVGGVWSNMRGQRGGRDTDVARAGYVGGMEAPADNECCPICHDPFTLPCQANCAHWFCGECILRVWQHTSALQPCKCPICRRSITLLIPSDVATAPPEDRTEEEILSDIAKYNRIFGGGVVSLIQRIRDMPLLLRRLIREMMDPQRALSLIHRTPILFYAEASPWDFGVSNQCARFLITFIRLIFVYGDVVPIMKQMTLTRLSLTCVQQLLFLAFYIFSPLDIIPEGIVGLVGLLDDLLVMVVVLFYLAMLYRSTLLLHHGGHGQ